MRERECERAEEEKKEKCEYRSYRGGSFKSDSVSFAASPNGHEGTGGLSAPACLALPCQIDALPFRFLAGRRGKKENGHRFDNNSERYRQGRA